MTEPYEQFTLQTVTLPVDQKAMTIDDLKSRLRIDINDDDLLLESFLLGAQEKLEREYELILLDTELAVYWDSWPCGFVELPKQKVTSITSIEYYDTTNNLQTFNDWESDLFSDPARILPVSGSDWPELYPKMNAVKITYNAGYADESEVPQQIKLALGLLVGHYYENREDSSPLTIKEIPQGVKSIMSTFMRGLFR